MRRKKEKFNSKMNCLQAFSVVMAVGIALSVSVGIVVVDNVSLSMNVEAAQNMMIGGVEEGFMKKCSFEVKVPHVQDTERLKVPQKETVNVSKDNKSKDVILPVIFQNKTGLRVFSFTRDATRGEAVRNFVNVPHGNENEIRNISILKTARKEASTENHEMKEEDMTDRRIAEILKPKSEYKAPKVDDSKLTAKSATSDSSIE
ncbi:hypothetical protein DRN80_00645 [Methanosarcinales archaeon]|nr:MAG: hypothetical protein DRN80_00645 [Methanosarcinales archaeon]